MIFLLGACVRAFFIPVKGRGPRPVSRSAADPGPPQALSGKAPELCTVPVLQRIMSSAVGVCANGRDCTCAAHAVPRPGHALLLAPIRVSLAAAWLVLAAVLWPPASFAQDYPAHPVKIVVPFGAGGPADVYSRVLAQHLSEALKQPFVVEDRPGAGSIIGSDAVAKSPPDGYTLLAMSNTHTTNESLIANKPFVLMRDFVPVAAVNYSDLVMVIHPSVPAKDLRELIAYAKARPGELNYASSGTGTPYHMAAELFKAMSGTNLIHVPHKASGEARNSVIGGHVQMMFDAITTMASNVKAGQVRALGTSALRRSTVLPEVPTIAEAGVPGYESTIWIGIMAPADTPQAIVDKLNAGINQVIDRADVKEAWEKQGALPLKMSPAEFDKFLRADIEKWAHVIKVSGMQTQ
jgi:tripartite-type tricarboxylate transporter receptor subunit TctC